MANAIQYSDRPAGVAVVLKGERGTGKGVFISTFMKLFGQYDMQIFNAKNLVGNFNAHLQKCIFLFADEAFYAGDKQGEATLKGLVTEKNLVIERKGIDAVSTPNYLHIVMASNSEWVVPAGNQERRFFILEVGTNKMQAHNYLGQLSDQMDEAGLEAMMDDLLNRDISDFNIFDVRKNEAFDEQIIRSMDPSKQWWYDLLDKDCSDDEWRFQERATLQMSFSEYTSTKYSRGTATMLGMFLAKIIPGGNPKKIKRKGNCSSLEDYDEFPSLDKCRDYFCKKVGITNKWNTLDTPFEHLFIT